jgi:hypothetical protein
VNESLVIDRNIYRLAIDQVCCKIIGWEFYEYRSEFYKKRGTGGPDFWTGFFSGYSRLPELLLTGGANVLYWEKKIKGKLGYGRKWKQSGGGSADNGADDYSAARGRGF